MTLHATHPAAPLAMEVKLQAINAERRKHNKQDVNLFLPRKPCSAQAKSSKALVVSTSPGPTPRMVTGNEFI
jgi:hypothetical protein